MERFFDREEAAGCPRTFVYELPAALDDYEEKKLTSSTSFPGLVFSSDVLDENANLVEVMVDRVKRSKRCAAPSPEEADLFLVPVLPRSKHWSEWSTACDGIAKVDWPSVLPHLNEETARRHFFVFPRVAYAPRCRGWWVRPQRSVAGFGRVSIGGYEEIGGDFERSKTKTSLSSYERERPETVLPRLASVPYVATVRWSLELDAAHHRRPWHNASPGPRPRLFAYSATPHGSPNAVRIRTALGLACRDAGPTVCVGGSSPPADSKKQKGTVHGAADPTALARLEATYAKRNTTFCLEPPGLTPGRQSIVNALLLGCIPVLFAPEQDLLWPLHWGGWRADSRVLLDPGPINKDPNQIIQMLKAIPQDRVRFMQQTIARRAHAFQYALDDFPGDALETTLNALHQAA